MADWVTHQNGSNDLGGQSSPFTVTLGGAPSVGDVIYVVIGSNSNWAGESISGICSTWNVQYDALDNNSQRTFFAWGIASNTNTVITFSWTAGGALNICGVAHAATPPTGAGTPTWDSAVFKSQVPPIGPTSTSPSITGNAPTQSDSLHFSCFYDSQGGTEATPTGWVLDGGTSGNGHSVTSVHLINSGTTAQTCGWALQSGHTFPGVSLIGAFDPNVPADFVPSRPRGMSQAVNRAAHWFTRVSWKERVDGLLAPTDAERPLVVAGA